MAGSVRVPAIEDSTMLRFGVAAIILLLAHPAMARPEEDECLAGVGAMRVLAAALPADDLSRRFAEHELETAVIEMNSGEVDECGEFLERAQHIILTRPYVLRPGETFGVPLR